MRKRLKADVRKDQILNAAIILAMRVGYTQMSRAQVAEEAQCSEASVTHYFTNMHQLRKYLMRHAVKNNLLGIIGQGVAHKDPIALRVSNEIQKQAVASLV